MKLEKLIKHKKKSNSPKMLLWIVMILLYIVYINAELETEQYQVKIPINLQFTCTLNNGIPSNITTLNISIYYQNGTNLVNNVQTESQGQGYVNITGNVTSPFLNVSTVQGCKLYAEPGNLSIGWKE